MREIVVLQRSGSRRRHAINLLAATLWVSAALIQDAIAVPADAAHAGQGNRPAVRDDGSEGRRPELDGIVVTGSVIRDESVFQGLPRSTIDAEEIAALHAATVADLLRGIPGVDVTQQGGSGGLTFVSLRGGDPNFTVVMIDGVKVDDPTNAQGGGFDFTGLDPLLIERIDVYFGSYSAVYGSDSLGGAINVTTKGPGSSAHAGAGLEVGTDDAFAASVELGGPLIGRVADASVVAVTRQGEEAVAGASLTRRQFIAKLRKARIPDSQTDWTVQYFGSRGEARYFPISSGGDRLAVVRESEQKVFEQHAAMGNLEWLPASLWRTRLTGSWSCYHAEIDSPAIAPGILSGVPATTTQNRFERFDLVFANTLALSKTTLLGFGAEYIREDGAIDSVIDFGVEVPVAFEKRRESWAIFGEVAHRLSEALSVVATLRRDEVGGAVTTNGRVAATGRIEATGTTAVLSYAEGFKLPSLFAIGHPLTGNPDLNSETSRNYTLELQQPLLDGRANIGLALYRNQFEDLVDFDGALFRHVNRDSALAEGADLVVDSNLGRWRVTANVGYLDATVSDGARLEARPKWKGGMTLSWQPAADWRIAVRAKINGSMYDTAIPTGTTRIDGHTRIDATVCRSLAKAIDFKLMLTNAFNSRYEEAIGFSNAGRQIRIAIEARL